MGHSKRAPHLTGAFDLFGKSKAVVMRNAHTFAILYLLPFLSVLASLAGDNTNKSRGEQFAESGNFTGLPTNVLVGFIGLGIVFFLVLAILSIIIETMTYTLELEGSKGEKPSLQHLFEVAKKYWLRIFGLLLAIGFLTLIGLILLIVPGLIVIRRYFLAPYVMIDKDLSISEAMRESARLTKINTGAIWGIIGVMFLIGLLSVIPLVGPLVSFGVGVLYSVAPALRYRELKAA